MGSSGGEATRLKRILVGGAVIAGPIAVLLTVASMIAPPSDTPVGGLRIVVVAGGPVQGDIHNETRTLISNADAPTDLKADAPSDLKAEAQTDLMERSTARREAERRPRPSFAEGSTVVVRVRNGKSIELLDSPRGDVISTQGDETEFGSPSVFWVRRHMSRWLGISTPDLPNNEIAWVRADPRLLKGEVVRHSVVVDLSARRAQLFEMGRRVSSWPVTVGAPGTETPTGRFAITDTFAGDLNAAYGCCAFALSATQPIVPSGWLGGDRIALHGTAGPLGVAASAGCVRSADRDLRFLLETVELGTPVLIRS